MTENEKRKSTMDWVMDREKANAVVWHFFDAHRERMIDLQRARFRVYEDGIEAIREVDPETAQKAIKIFDLVERRVERAARVERQSVGRLPTPR